MIAALRPVYVTCSVGLYERRGRIPRRQHGAHAANRFGGGVKYRLWRTFTCRQGIIPREWPPVPWDFSPLVPGSPVEAAQIGIKRSPEATLWYVVGNSGTTRYTPSVRKGARCLCELRAICLADLVDGAVHAQVALLDPDRALADALGLVHGVAHEQDGDVAIPDEVLDAALALLLGLCRWNVKACYE